MAIRAFLSFVQEDLNLVNLFRGQAQNVSNELEFVDYSIREPFNSSNVDYITQGIVRQIKPCTLAVCLYGPTTHRSQWVVWELNKAVELGKPIMGVCLYRDGRVVHYPAPLKNWPRISWDIPNIVQTMAALARQFRVGGSND
jgi:hypothetical protein